MTMWIAVLGACALSFLLKFSGYVVPERYLQRPWMQRVIPLLPVALLSSLLVTQAALSSGGTLQIDARAAGIGVAVMALWLRAPFLVVIVAAAITAAVVRML
ncbi:AzlD domain-containing protein [Ornithinimicrobium sp. Arc0846-15]|nr:AzlD domain-containing protein [Ornithinimicrobium laminariae]